MTALKRILLVDDDDDLREALSEQLVLGEEFDVYEADSGHTAMEKAQAGRFDLMAGLPNPRFPGGDMMRTPVLALAMTWYALRDRLGL
mgnify:CR=1 FL=1